MLVNYVIFGAVAGWACKRLEHLFPSRFAGMTMEIPLGLLFATGDLRIPQGGKISHGACRLRPAGASGITGRQIDPAHVNFAVREARAEPVSERHEVQR